ncbi:MAG: 16S rRNA (cytosine(1402)-N(4))-methyltransferase RsmH [Sediminibacterium sp.]|nr:16S rRNA (cytosine(1402)-N(4))-methyltransferase RsmH [Sediminibacterium sp.]
MSNPVYHIPVLLQDCIDQLTIRPDGAYVDLTFGGGGHSKAILSVLGESGKLIAFDQDEDAQRNVPDDKRFTLIPQNFRYLKNYLRLQGVAQVDGILGDLGVSSHQFDEASRGFSIRYDGRLDMRMNQKGNLTAEKIIREYSEQQLQKLFQEYGEVENARKLAQTICTGRESQAFDTTDAFKQLIKTCVPRFDDHKYLARVFQALRIEVNQEMEALKECLTQCVEVLKPGGRLVVMSYHSLEDRLVKNLMKTGNVEGKEEKDVIYGSSKKVFKNLTGKPILPSEEEIKINTRARSAKLRVAEKL